MNRSHKRPEQDPSNVGDQQIAGNLNFVERRLIPRAFPSPEVIEGCDSSDWALWEEAVANQAGSKPISTAEKDEHALDPFTSFRKHGG